MNYLHIKFSGWFQSRFATNPDPADDPRGTRGFSRALPGEPDFDRIIRFQPEGTFMRSHVKQEVGVKVTAVFDARGYVVNHPLLETRVNLEDNPIFKGENKIVAGDGNEPIVPFKLSVTNAYLGVVRSSSLDLLKMPFEELRPSSFATAPGKVAESTGIHYIKEMQKRIDHLKNEEQDSNTVERINRLEGYLKSGTTKSLFSSSAERIFNTIQTYNIQLKGPVSLLDQNQIINQKIDIHNDWIVNFWMGGWDIDASCGFVEGHLSIPQIES